jgi:sugar phosphate isomerase/epimerase
VKNLFENGMRIGIVTDEISTDAREAIRLGTSWGLKDYELRVIGDTRVPAITSTIVEELLRLKEEFGIRYTALSPGVFKGRITDSALLQNELNATLPETFRLANSLDTKMIIVFGFQKSPGETATEKQVVEAFAEAAELARRNGFILAIENEPGFWCDTGANTARILAAVNSPALRANWDPGNAFGTDETPYPDGYHAIKKWIANVHVKDTIRGALLECVPVGEGKIDWVGQLQALSRDQLVDHVTIETHCHPLIENSKKNVEAMRRILAMAG